MRAAIILLPLLGVNNGLSLIPAPLCDVTNFTVLYVFDHATSSLQGFFIALLHCMLNGEVSDRLTLTLIQTDLDSSLMTLFSTTITNQ